MILEILDTWVGRGILAFLITYFATYLPYSKNHYNRTPTVDFQIFLLIVCILLGRVAFWIAIIMAIINSDEWRK